jgi:predicted nucleotidyltransferase
LKRGDHLQDLIESAVERIVSAASPLRIILFGSAARQEIGPNSDLDMMVVIPTGRHRRKTAQKIYRNMIDLGFAVDVVVVTEEDLERFAENPGMIIGAALKEGRELYAA